MWTGGGLASLHYSQMSLGCFFERYWAAGVDDFSMKLFRPRLVEILLGCKRGKAAIFWAGQSPTIVLPNRGLVTVSLARLSYSADPPGSSFICLKVARNGNDCGRCNRMGRTDANTRDPSFKKRFRSVQT